MYLAYLLSNSVQKRFKFKLPTLSDCQKLCKFQHETRKVRGPGFLWACIQYCISGSGFNNSKKCRIRILDPTPDPYAKNPAFWREKYLVFFDSCIIIFNFTILNCKKLPHKRNLRKDGRDEGPTRSTSLERGVYLFTNVFRRSRIRRQNRVLNDL